MKGGKKKASDRDMISIHFYREEIERFLKFLDYAQSFCEETLLEAYQKEHREIGKWQRNFKLILKQK